MPRAQPIASARAMFDEQLKSLPAQPPRSLELLPGLGLRRAVPAMALLFPVLFLVFFTVVPLSLMQADPAMRFAISQTGYARGSVLRTVDTVGCRGAKARRLIYQFSVQQSSYRGGVTVCEPSMYFTSKVGEPVQVHYLSKDPSINRLRGNNPPTPTPVLLLLFTPVFILAMLGSVFWPPLRELLRARRLFRQGQLASGTVVFVRRRSAATWRGWSGSSADEVFVEFNTPDGRKREGVTRCSNDWLINHLAPGTTIHVAYDDRSNRVALLEAFVR